jgi:signal transduction histidine kinase
VATLIARDAAAPDVYAAVAAGINELLGLPMIGLWRYDPDEQVTVIGAAGDHPFQVGTRWPLATAPLASMVRQSGEAMRIADYRSLPSRLDSPAREAGVRSAIGVPILIHGQIWGLLAAASDSSGPLPPDTEERLAGFTELVGITIANAIARLDLERLMQEQDALRRVALMVAEGSDTPAILDAVCRQTALVLGATSVNLARFTPDEMNLTLAGWSVRDTHVPIGTRLPLDGETINMVIRRTAAPARVDDYAAIGGELAALIRRRGITCEVGAPVIIQGQLVGALIAGWDTSTPPPPGTEDRLARFAELMATAVASVQARADLARSRARLVATADEARRRIERDLHDGIQQRLVSLGLDLGLLVQQVQTKDPRLAEQLHRAIDDIDEAVDEVREIARGVHPALLTQAGLEGAVRTLARRTPIETVVQVSVPGRASPSTEIAAYYLVAEALANAVKHAHASTVRIAVTVRGRRLRVSVRDDGVGGATLDAGSGLAGLVDRVEALGGRFSIRSPEGRGTTVAAELPLVALDGDDVGGPPSAARAPRGAGSLRVGSAAPSDLDRK